MKTYSNAPHHNEQLISRPCAVCGAQQPRLYWRLAGWLYVRCRQCGHVYQDPQPDQQALQARYAQQYFEYEQENEQRFLQLMLLGLADAHIEVRLLRRLTGNGIASTAPPLPRLLDVGCATGALLAHYQKQGWQTQGVELCREAADWGEAQRGVSIFKGQLIEAQFPAASFDFIHASHLIEHLPDPYQLLEECRRLIAPRGLIVIVTPDRAGWQAKLLGRRWRSAIADHLQLFDFSHLRRLARRAKLQVLYKCSWGGLAQGMTPRWIKGSADYLAKRFNIGDVMLVVLQPSGPG